MTLVTCILYTFFFKNRKFSSVLTLLKNGRFDCFSLIVLFPYTESYSFSEKIHSLTMYDLASAVTPAICKKLRKLYKRAYCNVALRPEIKFAIYLSEAYKIVF